MSETQQKKPLLEVKDLKVTFGTRKQKFVAVNGVSFTIYEGETFGLVGESGSGKTTIGRSIIRINPTSGGEILYKGKKINGPISKELDRELTRRIQMIFQDPMASLNERAKVDYIVSEGLYNCRRCQTEAQRREEVDRALTDVGLLPEFASRFPHEFSGGQRQRIGIARALIMFTPKPLFAGARVALIAPAGPVPPERFGPAVTAVEELSLEPVIFESCRRAHGYFAGNDQLRADDINAAFADNTIDGIFCIRGGYGAQRLMNLIDWNMVSPRCTSSPSRSEKVSRTRWRRLEVA